MTQLVAEGFATYGFGDITAPLTSVYPQLPSKTSAVGIAMLSGVWAELPLSSFDTIGTAFLSHPHLGTLPWAPADTDLYVSRCTATYNTSEGTYLTSSCYRRVLPVASAPVILSQYYAINFLPPLEAAIVGFADATNTVAAWLFLTASGGLQLRDSAGSAVLAQTTGPVIVAEQAYHLEMEFSPTAGTFTLNVNGTAAITATGLGALGANPTAQLRFFPAKYETNVARPTQYLGNLIVRNTLGTRNNAIVGDRRVATLMVNKDDPAHQGWTNHPLKKFGAGIADMATSLNSFISYNPEAANSFQVGAKDYTFEGQVRFAKLPDPGLIEGIFSSWGSGSPSGWDWVMALGSNTYNNGQLYIEATTDGTLSTAQTLWSYPWAPELDTWYHIAFCRLGGVISVYIDGKQLGPTAIDATTYAYTNKGARVGSIALNNDSALWVDDLRWTIGTCRYTGNFTKPAAALPIGSTLDAHWADVALRTTYDDLTPTDLSQYNHYAVYQGGAVGVAPTDGVYNFQSMDNVPPLDNVFISADFLPAQANLSVVAVPANGDTVTVATKDGTTAAVYTWKTALAAAYDVLIGLTTTACAANLTAAINGAAGLGTTYGTGTLANNDVIASDNPGPVINVVATVPGTVGNSLASTATGTAATWDSAHLYGGVDIPAYSQFGTQRLPANATLVDSVTLATRMWKTDAGTATVQNSLVGRLGGVKSGVIHAVSTAPTVYLDTFETDPDNSAAPLSPAVVTQMLLRLNRAS